jgi:hypothetical protein
MARHLDSDTLARKAFVITLTCCVAFAGAVFLFIL